MKNKDREEFYNDVFGWNDIAYYDKAYAVAKDAHAGQLRDEGTPYINHIDGVLDILRNELRIRSDMYVSVAALHDVLEDSNKYDFDFISRNFNEDIANAVQLLTLKDGQKIDDYLLNITSSEYASWLIMIKLSDRLHNIRSLPLIADAEKKVRKCEETRIYYMKYAQKYSAYLYDELDKALKLVEKVLRWNKG